MHLQLIADYYRLLKSENSSESLQMNTSMGPSSFAAICLSQLSMGNCIRIQANSKNAIALNEIFKSLELDLYTVIDSEVKDLETMKALNVEPIYDESHHKVIEEKLRFIEDRQIGFYEYFYQSDNQQNYRRAILEKRLNNSIPRGYIDLSKLTDVITDMADITDLEDLRQEMIKATKLYKKEFDLINKNNKSQGILQLENSEILKDRHILRQQLSNLRTELYATRKEIIAYQEHIMSEWSNEFNKKLKLCSDRLSEFELDLLSYISLYDEETAIKPGLFNLNKTQSKKYERYLDIQQKFFELKETLNHQGLLSIHPQEDDDIPSIITIVKKLKFSIDELNEFFTSQYRLKIKQVNIINSTDDRLKKIHSELLQMTEVINSSDLFCKRYELNSRSVDGIKEYAENLIFDIENALYILSHEEEYFTWFEFYSQSSRKFRLLFEEIKHLPKEYWVKTTKQLYIELLCMKFKTEKIFGNLFVIKSIDEIKRVWFDEELNKIKFNASTIIKRAMKTTSKKELTTMLKSGEQFNSLQSVFPISISVCDTDGITLQIWNNDNLNIIKDFKISYSSAFSKPGNIPVYEYPYESLSQLDRSELLEASKILAKQFSSIEIQAKIYSIKDSLIVSTLSDTLHQLLLQNLQNAGMKDLNNQQIDEDKWLELLIWSGGKIVLLIQDQLLAPSQYQYVENQQMILGEIKKAGIEILDISTAQVMDTGLQSILKIAHQIIPHAKDKAVMMNENNDSLAETEEPLTTTQ